MLYKSVLMIGITAIPLWPISRFTANVVQETGSEQYVLWTRDAVQTLQKGMDDFSLRLEYHGLDSDNHRSLYLSVKPLPDKLPPSYASIRISREQAAILIGHLAADGFLYRGTVNRSKQLVTPSEPYYDLYAGGPNGHAFFEFLPWAEKPYRWHGMERPPLVKQLDNLRAVLLGDAAKAMDILRSAVEKQQK